MRAFLKNSRTAPRKMRLIANAVRGKRVSQALAQLSLMPQQPAHTLAKLIGSAVANARAEFPAVKDADLSIAKITVDKGITFVRYMPRAMGRATPIHRECSHVHVELAPIAGAALAAKPALKTVAKKGRKTEVKAPAPENKTEGSKRKVQTPKKS